MERVLKENGESASSKRAAQRKSAQHLAQDNIASRIDNSPHMIAQRKKLQSLFGGAAQLQGAEDEMLQGKFETAQRVEDEELLQGKFETVQRVENEELLQGKFATAQRVEEEEPLQGKFETAQRVEEEEPLQGKFEAVQRVEEEEPLQGKFTSEAPAQMKAEPAAKPNNTGLPDNLKSGIENLSGMSMDNVKVHYNSSQPAQLNALAYAQGTDIHVAPGQERHLPHEAWHVVQQAQGRVQPTMQMKEGVPVNDDIGLEHEADVMGAKATQLGGAMGKENPDSHGTADMSSSYGLLQREKESEELWNEADGLDEKEEDSNFEFGRAFGDVNDSEAEDENEDENKSTLKLGENESVSLGEDGLEIESGDTAIGIGKDGPSATIKPFGDEGPTLKLQKDEGEISFELPGTGFSFPPPNGKWQGPSLELPIATPIPGLFINVSGGLEGGISIPALEMKMTYSQKKMGKHDDLTRVKVTFVLANGSEIAATFGGNIRVGVLGGVPMVAAVEAGIEAAAEAMLEIAPSISGQAEYLVNEETEEEISSREQLSISMGASAGLEASLSLYVAGQIIMFKGDLFKLTLLSKEIASAKGGALLKKTWIDGNKGENSIEPIYDDYFVAESWFKDLFTADKLDKATEKLTNAQYDVYALEDLQRFLKLGTKQGQTATSEVRKAMSEFRAAETEFIMKNKELENESLSLAQQGKIKKDIDGLMKTMRAANIKWSAAQNEFGSEKNIKKLDKNLASAIKSLENTKGDNEKLMLKELLKFENEYGPKRDKLLKDHNSAINCADQIQSWLSSAPESKTSFYESQLSDANKEKLRVQTDLEEFMRTYEAQEAKIRALIEAPSKEPVVKPK